MQLQTILFEPRGTGSRGTVSRVPYTPEDIVVSRLIASGNKASQIMDKDEKPKSGFMKRKEKEK